MPFILPYRLALASPLTLTTRATAPNLLMFTTPRIESPSRYLLLTSVSTAATAPSLAMSYETGRVRV